MSDASTQQNTNLPAEELVQTAVELLQEDALPGVWTKGVNLSRVSGSVVAESGDEDSGEWKFRVIEAGRAVHPQVTLWLSHDDDFDSHCSCGDRNEPCHHIVAVALALKGGRTVKLADAATSAHEARTGTPAASGAGLCWVEYRLSADAELRLAVTRVIRRGATQEPLSTTLVAHLGGIRSGRISAPPVATTEEDLKLDSVFGPSPGTRVIPDTPAWAMILKLFKRLPEGRLRWFTQGERVTGQGAPDGRVIRAETETERDTVVISTAPGGAGFVARRVAKAETGTDTAAFTDFLNGVRLQSDVLRPLPPSLTQSTRAERELFSQTGLPRARTVELLTEVLPSLRNRFDVRIDGPGFPELVSPVSLHSEIRLEADPSSPGTMIAVPTLVYADPARSGSVVASLERAGDGWRLEDAKRVPDRDLAREHELVRLLQSELHLSPGGLTRHSGEEAALFRKRLEEAAGRSRGRIRVTGAARERFTVRDEFLRPRVSWDAQGRMQLEFVLGPSSAGPGGAASGSIGVSARAAFDAWRRGDSTVLLGAGGFAKLPVGWFDRYGHEIERLLLVRPLKQGDADPLAFERADFALSIDPDCKARIPQGLFTLREKLAASLADEDFGDFPDSRTPLRSHRVEAQLRPYQRLGVRWMRLLGDHGLGALLADDMGLGKTLQAIEASEGRTLVVCPTSVLYAWETQLERFSPKLRVSRYHGPSRRLDTGADLTLTTYGVLRQDQGVLTTTAWDTVILDEAQTIKNPDSQVAQAAHELQAPRRIALSGTPLENHLEELWSSMRFLNPQLLGDRKSFLMQTEERGGIEHLRKRLRPFFLRRLKREVARDLPPRTEQVLECELTSEERKRYEALWLASRREVIEALEAGTGTMQALELLLRLRQASCHTGLLPGFEDTASSSKVELLADTLRTALENEHRVLVFSQWTRMLDRIETRLRGEKGIEWLRLDGSTSREERAWIVERFQAAGPDTPRVLLLSLKAGGTGLTLTAADTVILTDPWWNPAVEDQAADRAHRIGQSLPVTVIRLIAKDSVEERILALQQEKRALAEAVFGPGSEAPAEEGAAQAAGLGTRELLRLLGE